jgi:hypothetical protein
MQTAKLSTFYFALSALLAVAAACASPCLALPHTRSAFSAVPGSSVFPMDAQIALAR